MVGPKSFFFPLIRFKINLNSMEAIIPHIIPATAPTENPRIQRMIFFALLVLCLCFATGEVVGDGAGACRSLLLLLSPAAAAVSLDSANMYR
ncbi:hypothetical protein HanXRQr2_Chr16g0722821 [Helianthus annuus]|uniref:Uncharacterized protein n=1 Tax=Helianthus annuus TaxID=4232 RepID=A0A9K3DLP9_HELAN|nr:hypothetical protein HanXRQr2_Chr16g0722821 [Helianthus annuus]KAJ0819193.1 hypothetical protein HanPSC8_Chr16g0693311 [Helianthus annuus]